MEPVAVTGAAGLIGGALSRRLIADGVEVIAVDTVAPAGLDGAELRRADIADPVAIAAALRGAGRVVHAAALVRDRGTMAEFVRVNTRGTRNVLDAAEREGAGAVVLGSVAGWGYEFRRDLPESAPPRHRGPAASRTSIRRAPRSGWRCCAATWSSGRATCTGPARSPGCCGRCAPCARARSGCRVEGTAS